MAQNPPALKQRRADLLADRERVGSALCRPITELMLTELQRLWNLIQPAPPDDWSLLAIGGTARGSMCPASDLDLLLLHGRKAPLDAVAEVAEALWYPLWDAGATVSPLVHSVESLTELIRHDVAAATSVLDVRLIAGSDRADDVRQRAHSNWLRRAKQLRPALEADIIGRHARFGDVGVLLEPDVKDGRGGLRDRQALGWLALLDESAAAAEDRARSALDSSVAVMTDVRAELHRSTGRAGNKLLLQEQDHVAAALGTDADGMMRSVSEAGHVIAWHLDRALRPRRGSHRPRRTKVGDGIDLVGGELELRPDLAPSAAAVLALAAAAAHDEIEIAEATLDSLSEAEWPTPDIWTGRMRRDLISLLGAGSAMVPVVEALDHSGLMGRILDEWNAVRFKPQRNAFHQFTVDRHLVQCAANAAELVRRVSRPDLLLLGALLHDIGKGYPGDHTEVGEPIVRAIGERLGLPADDVERLALMERHHLLLPEVATRRDLSDPGTIDVVVYAAGDADMLDLLHALTIADSKATGPSAWSDWKARLVEELVTRAKAVFGGHRQADIDPSYAEDHADLLAVAADGRAHVQSPGPNRVVVVAPDRRGLFGRITGVLSLHGVDIVSAEAWTSDDGVAVDDFEIRRKLGGETNWRRVQSDLRAVLGGELDLAARLAERARSYRAVGRARSAQPPRAEVLVDNNWSATSTVIEVRAPDGVGVLFRVSSLLEQLELDIRKAKVATLGHEVVDVFYVGRVPDVRLGEIEAALAAALHIDS